jgi:cytochrome c oxidase subunit 2
MFAHIRLIGSTAVCLGAFLAASAPLHGGDPVLGQKLFLRLGCQTCHTVNGVGGPSGSAGGATETKAPELAGIYGKSIEMSDGSKVEVTDAYLLESIVKPRALVCMDEETGRPYPADKMPDRFKYLPKEQLDALVAYIKLLSGIAPAGVSPAEVGIPAEDAVTDHGPAKVVVWIWGLLGGCVCLVVGGMSRKMSRNISWKWIGGIVAIPFLAALAGVAFAHHATGGSEREIEVVARQFAYDPPIIKVNKGDHITVTLTSKDVLHGFYLDGYGIDEEIRPGEKVRFSFVANKPGKFPFRCSHTCGVFHPFMIGNLIVSPNYLFHASIGLCFGLGLATFLYIANKKE